MLGELLEAAAKDLIDGESQSTKVALQDEAPDYAAFGIVDGGGDNDAGDGTWASDSTVEDALGSLIHSAAKREESPLDRLVSKALGGIEVKEKYRESIPIKKEVINHSLEIAFVFPGEKPKGDIHDVEAVRKALKGSKISKSHGYNEGLTFFPELTQFRGDELVVSYIPKQDETKPKELTLH